MLYFKKERDLDFIAVCRQIESSLLSDRRNSAAVSANRNARIVSPREVYTAAVNQPAKSFYIADLKKMIWKIHKCRKNINRDSPRGQLYHDLLQAYFCLKKNFPDDKNSEILMKLDLLNAPRFYITPNHAKTLYYKSYKLI